MSGFATIIFSAGHWLVPALAALVLLAATLLWAGRRSATERRVRIGCALLKLAGILMLVICLLEPLRVGQRARPGANFFALIADNSQSLTVKDTGETRSRGEHLRGSLGSGTKGWQPALEESFQVRRYLFDTQLRNVRDFSELNFAGRASALGHALKTAAEQWRGQPVAGALLFTDGDATDLGDDLPPLDGCPPVYPVIVGRDTGLTDLSLNQVGVSQTAFEDAPVTIQANVAASGFAGSEIVARLTEVAASSPSTATNPATVPGLRVSASSNVVAELTQSARGSEANVNFRFQIQPANPGIHFYELEARARSELDHPNTPTREATLVNNRQMFVVDRGQEPFRVLYVSGRPNWDYKFLNRAIQADPQVKLVSLIRIARREPRFEFKGREGESSNPLFRGFGRQDEEDASYDQPVLIRLNTKDEFELRGGFPHTAEELFKYDAVIVADLEADFFTHDQIALLQRFVSERGGGFLMLGGAESFRQGNYAGTLIASMLPVYLDRPVNAPLPAAMKLTLTREGWLQPWTRLRATESEEKSRLDDMPGFEVINQVSDIKPGASVLARVTDADGRTYPALAAQRYGSGRTGALMIGDFWRWGLRDPGMQKDLEKSWRQLVRWLVSDVPPQIAVVPEPSVSGNSAGVRLTVTARDEEFQPLDNATVRLTVRPVRMRPAENGAAGVADNDFVQMTAEPSATTPGKYEATYIPRDTGAYSVEAVVTRADGRLAGQAAAGWASDPAADEFRSLKPNRVLMEAIARRTGGEVVKLEDLDRFVRQLPRRHAPITETWTQPLWQNPLVFLFVLGCFVTEWGIRRWKGMP
ncbi:MAG: glutamine amidotransferase [Verrucomicrobiota bacterium]